MKDGWETPPARVCLQNGRVAVCAFLALSLSTFQPIILQGEGALNVITLKPTQPLILSHANSRGSLVISIPVCFFSITSSSRFYICTNNPLTYFKMFGQAA